MKRLPSFIRKSLLHLLLLGGAIVMMIPFFWMITTSLKFRTQVFTYPPQFIPTQFVWQNYVDSWNAVPFARYYLNSTFVSLMITLGQLATCSLAAYAFARLRFFGRNVIFLIFLGTMMVPFQLTMIPLYFIMGSFKWIDTYYALIVPFSTSAFGIFLLRQFFIDIPTELEDAARIDGCSRIGILFKIILPLSKPALATLGIFTFMFSWNSFLWPLIVTNSDEMYVIQLGLSVFRDAYGGVQWALLMAATSMATIPVLIVFFFGQKQFIQGITLTGLKE